MDLQHPSSRNDRTTTKEDLIFDEFESSKLWWYKNSLINKWEIVYKITSSKEHIGCWIVSNSYGKYFTVNEENLHLKPTTNNIHLSTKQIIDLTIQTLTQSFTQINVCLYN